MATSKKSGKDPVSDNDKKSEKISFKKEDVFANLQDMLSELLDMPKKDLQMDTEIFEELPLDSLQLYELVVDLETRYDIRIPDEAIEKVTTIGDVVEMVSEAGK